MYNNEHFYQVKIIRDVFRIKNKQIVQKSHNKQSTKCKTLVYLKKILNLKTYL